MKSKKALTVLSVFALFVLMFNIVGIVMDVFFYTIEDVPKGTLVGTYPAPDGEDKVNVYVVNNPIGNAVRCEAVSGDETRNIYWEIGTDRATVTWIGETVVYVNGKTLDIHRSSYDSRDINEELESHFEDRYTVYQ